MKRAFLLALALLAFLPVGQAHAAQCGLPDTQPLWIDYAEGAVTFRNELFGKPGIVAASSGTAVPAALRARGAQTIYWAGKFGDYVGTTLKPADPSTIDGAAQRMFDRAVASTGCQTPQIVINELNGAGTTTPWTVSNSGYRANVLALLQGLFKRGAHPYLLVNSTPYTGGEAKDWWLAAGGVADMVQEVYFNAPSIMRSGVVLGSRRMRSAFRNALQPYRDIGFPGSKLGIILGFQSGPGTGGREGLQPTSAWLEFVKLNTLAGKQVANELHLATM